MDDQSFDPFAWGNELKAMAEDQTSFPPYMILPSGSGLLSLDEFPDHRKVALQSMFRGLLTLHQEDKGGVFSEAVMTVAIMIHRVQRGNWSALGPGDGLDPFRDPRSDPIVDG